MNQLMTINPADFDELLKVMKVLKAKSVAIRDNKIIQNLGTTVIEVTSDIQLPNIEFPDVASYVKKLRLLVGNDQITVYEDGSIYVLTNGKVSVKVPKIHSSVVPQEMDTTGWTKVSEVQLDEKTVKNLSPFTVDKNVTIYLDETDTIMGISTDEIEFLMPGTNVNITQMQSSASKKLLSRTFLPIQAPSDYSLVLHKKEEEYMLQTICYVGIYTINIYEPLEDEDALDII